MGTIQNGRGGSLSARVSAGERVFTEAMSESFGATAQGDSYIINTGNLNLTNDVETPVLYVKNNETVELHITSIAVSLSVSTAGDPDLPRVVFVRNPTTGTIISGATDVSIVENRNFSSASTLTVDAFKGATGLTITDGDTLDIIYPKVSDVLIYDTDFILGAGNSIGVKLRPPPSSTGLLFAVSLYCHLKEE